MNAVAYLMSIALCTPAAPTPAAAGREFTLLTIDGRTLKSPRLAINADGAVALAPAANVATVRLDDIARIVPPAAEVETTRATPRPNTVEFLLADGGRLIGRIVDQPSGGRGVMADVGLRRPVFLPFEALSAIRFAEQTQEAAERELQSRVAQRDATRDFLIAISPSGVTTLPGALEQLTPEEWAFRLGGQLRRGALERTYAIVLAGGMWSNAAETVRVSLRDGGVFSGAVAAADNDGVKVRASFGAELALLWKDIERLDVRSGRVEFLSDLKPVRAESRGFFGRAWPWRADAGPYGGPLRIGDERFARGLAVHSRSELTYDLNEPFAEFRATIGVDDSIHKSGNVIFRIRGDDRTLFDSGAVKAGDPPREISAALDGVRCLTLEVDFGEGLDLGDWAVWGQARLIR